MENFVFGNLPFGSLENALNQTCFRTNLPDLGVLYVLILVQTCQIWEYFMFLFQYRPARFGSTLYSYFSTNLPDYAYFMFLFQYNLARFGRSLCSYFSTTLPDLGVLYVHILVHPYQIWAYLMFLFQYIPTRFGRTLCSYFITNLPDLGVLYVLILVQPCQI